MTVHLLSGYFLSCIYARRYVCIDISHAARISVTTISCWTNLRDALKNRINMPRIAAVLIVALSAYNPSKCIKMKLAWPKYYENHVWQRARFSDQKTQATRAGWFWVWNLRILQRFVCASPIRSVPTIQPPFARPKWLFAKCALLFHLTKCVCAFSVCIVEILFELNIEYSANIRQINSIFTISFVRYSQLFLFCRSSSSECKGSSD